MAKTSTFTVGASPTKTPVVAVGWCNRIEIAEDPSVSGFPTTDFLISRPSSTDTQVRMAAGVTFAFDTLGTGPFYAGQTVGYVSCVGNSTTFAQIETGLN